MNELKKALCKQWNDMEKARIKALRNGQLRRAESFYEVQVKIEYNLELLKSMKGVNHEQV